MQKLVTIYLDRASYRTVGKKSPAESHGLVEEHLESYLTDGWNIRSIAGAGGGGGGGASSNFGCGWVVVWLEKS
jgi:hypothetical protein